VIADPATRTPDLGGSCGTEAMTDAIVAALATAGAPASSPPLQFR
jgi:hypothetical protein